MKGCIYRYSLNGSPIIDDDYLGYDAFLAPRCVVPRHLVEGRNLDRALQQ